MRRTLYILISALLVCSCNSGQIGKALTSLDEVIRQSESYNNEFSENADKLRLEYLNAGDHQKWALADSLYHMYYYNNLDSSLFYLGRMAMHVHTAEQRFRTKLYELVINMVRMNHKETVEEYHALDTVGISADKETLKAYYSTGISLYYHLYKSELPPESKMVCRQTLQQLRARYICLNAESFYSHKIMAQYDRENGDYQASLERLLDIYTRETDHHEKASTAYNIATIYKYLGNDDERIVWLARSAEEDFRTCGKDYLSLYELALMLYNKGMYIEASRYIERNLSDAFFGNFNSRYMNSSKAYVLVNDAERHNARNKMMLMIVIICFLVAVTIVMLGLLNYSARQRQRAREQRDMLSAVNDQVKSLNSHLVDANKIKDNYVFRYMEMSVRYLDRFDDFRNHIRSVAHSQGLDEAMKHLRSREDMYQENDKFYTVFDETFLDIYPDFVHKVNELLREDARFPIPTSRVLRTELRILAAIRLGITESGKIACFLKCAPPTVYTYRAKLRNSAICNKERFEDLVREIQ